jgi:hypothetical protein
MAVNKYWEKETPVIKDFGGTQLRLYRNAKKLQIFPLLPNTKYGVGKGVTVDFEEMTPEEVLLFGSFITAVTEGKAEEVSA